MVTMYTTSWCADCRATKAALEQLKIPYTEVDIDQDPTGEQKVLQANNGKRSVPTLAYGRHAASMSRFSIVKLKSWLQEAGLQ